MSFVISAEADDRPDREARRHHEQAYNGNKGIHVVLDKKYMLPK